MVGDLWTGAARALAVCALGGVMSQSVFLQASAETFVEHSAEVRMQLDFAVPNAALRSFLPAGWEPAVATSGAAKDCNLRMIFIDRVDVTGADGAALGSDRMVYLAIPIRQPATKTAGQMLIFGLTTDAKQAPGPFGVYLHADKHHMGRVAQDNGGGAPIVKEHWEFAAASGEHMQLDLTYERGVGRKGGAPTKFFSAANPGVYQIFKIEQSLDIMRNATVKVTDRVKDFRVTAGGGKIAPLFDGTERVLSIDALHWYNRGVYLP